MLTTKCKLFLLVSILAVGINTNLNAQVSLGLEGGLNISKVAFDYETAQVSVSSTNGFIAGAIINYKISPVLSLQSEIRYIRGGYQLNLGSSEKIINHLHYLEIPIYVMAEMPDVIMNPFLLVGINTGTLLKASDKYYWHESDITDLFNKMNLSIDVGLGIKHSFYKNVSMQLSGRYSHGIYNIISECKTRGMQIVLGVLYSL